jgi:hypothetical protein
MKRGRVALQKSGVQLALEGVAADAGVFAAAGDATDAAVLAALRRGAPAAELIA